MASSWVEVSVIQSVFACIPYPIMLPIGIFLFCSGFFSLIQTVITYFSCLLFLFITLNHLRLSPCFTIRIMIRIVSLMLYRDMYRIVAILYRGSPNRYSYTVFKAHNTRYSSKSSRFQNSTTFFGLFDTCRPTLKLETC